MKHRVYFDGPLDPEFIVGLREEEFHHLVRVNRARVGEEVEIFNGSGSQFRAVLEAIEPAHANLKLMESVAERESPLQITVAQALIQPEKFELVLQKATELGATHFIPLLTERVDLRIERVRGKEERWRRIVLEAVKQSGRTRVPQIEAPTALTSALQVPGVRLFFEPDRAATTPGAYERTFTLFIGPEGGWSERELSEAADSGASFRSLGPRRLRAETAAVAAVTMLQMESGDLLSER